MCDSPYSKQMWKQKAQGDLENQGNHYTVSLPCGKCYTCKKNRVNQWSHRIMQENNVSDSGYFVTLTYDTENVPINRRGYMTLEKTDLQKFFKLVRYYDDKKIKEVTELDPVKGNKAGRNYDKKRIKYYAVGEYGENKGRPHYHIIIFNVYDKKSIEKAWPKGNIDIQVVNVNTIDYTLKYINKDKSYVKSHTEQKREFSLMSKGMGLNYVTNESVRYHNSDLDNNYIVNTRGFKVPLSRYYRDKIFSKERKKDLVEHIKKITFEKEQKDREIFEAHNISYDENVQKKKEARAIKNNKSQKVRDFE